MNRRSGYLLLLSSAAILVLLTSAQITLAGSEKSACPQEQLNQLHEHWHSLALEKDSGVREKMIREHRQLLSSVEKSARAETSASDCKAGASMTHHDVENMVEMHTMMLNMIEK